MPKEKNPYSDTLNLPQTEFPMRANLPAREPDWVARWLKNDVYGKLREKRIAENADKFILHLGPPYANGHMHMGHALQYVLKDLIVRSKFMAGFDSPYVPGWDCHGLPIEWKVEEKIRKQKKTKYDFTTKEIRDKCRTYANEWIEIQREEWQRFGALGDWDNPYKTMDSANEAGIVAELGKMVQRGLVYKGLRSTMWSTVEETALAEAEVEYADKESTCIYVKFPIVGKENEYIVIWTTTPWTMPSNRAVAYAKDEEYVAIKVEAIAEECLAKIGDILWVAAKLQAEMIRTVGITEFATVGTKQGHEFASTVCKHPFYDREAPLLEGFHVTTEAGTGFVHIAPAHGQEDFQIGREVGLELHCPVQSNGVYDDTVKTFAGQHIWKAQSAIVDLMRENGSLLHTYKFTHSYPISWRSKAPLIYRATAQWFIALDTKIEALDGETLREAALDRIHATNGKKGVKWVPEYGENRIGSMIKNRPDWCISRQRAWGVPITVISSQKSVVRKIIGGEIITDKAVWEHIVSLVKAEGIDAWDSRIEGNRHEELFPTGWLKEKGLSTDDFEYARDIMDVWIDSGTTHAHVLRADAGEGGRFHRTDGKRPADLYQEGSDQHRGWFHSSLLTSVANYNDAPYEAVVTCGFVVDGNGQKFSKSLGNGVEPRQLLDRYGMDIIRLWVASSDYSEDIRYSEEIMKNTADAYRRFRNTFRFLLGNLHDFDENQAIKPAEMSELEQYILGRLGEVLTSVQASYNEYKFHHAYRTLYDFCNQELSNFYFDVRKDSLYCDAKNSPKRKACQTVLMEILKGLTTHLAPIMPFTTDEVWREQFSDDSCVHLETYAVPEKTKPNAKWAEILTTRDTVNKSIEALREAGKVGANVEVVATLPTACKKVLPANTWAEILVISSVNFGEKLSVAKANNQKCPRCWTYHETLQGETCKRCAEALQADRHEVGV